jgi:hypothetical protein
VKPRSNPKNHKAIQRSATKSYMSYVDLKKEAGAMYGIELPKGKLLHQVDAVRAHHRRPPPRPQHRATLESVDHANVV